MIFWKPSRFIVVVITSILALLYYSWGTNSWRFSFVGDEWAFFEKAIEIVSINFDVNPFDMKGVYLENPILGSLWQALFIKLFGATNFAWRFSNAFLIVPLSIVFYLWIKQYFSAQTALISTILIQASFYMANYFKLGVVNPQSVFLLVCSLYLSALAGRSGKILHLILLGITLGVSFYIYIGPLFAPIVSPYLIPLLKGNLRSKLYGLLKLALMGSIFFAMIAPGLNDKEHWRAVSIKTTKKEFTGNKQIFVNVYRNFLLFYKNYDYMFNHFISGPYLDVITMVFATAGLGVLIINIHKEKFLFLILTYIILAVLIGITSPYPYSPTSRGVFFIPFGCAFAGISLNMTRRRFGPGIVVSFLIMAIAVNIYRSQIEYFDKYGYKHTSLLLKELIDQYKINKIAPIGLFLSNSINYNHHNISIMQKAFGLDEQRLMIIKNTNDLCRIHLDKIFILDQDYNARHSIQNLSCSFINTKLKIISSTFAPY